MVLIFPGFFLFLYGILNSFPQMTQIDPHIPEILQEPEKPLTFLLFNFFTFIQNGQSRKRSPGPYKRKAE